MRNTDEGGCHYRATTAVVAASLLHFVTGIVVVTPVLHTSAPPFSAFPDQL